MRIGFDAKRAFYNTSGLGNYSRSLISAIHFYYPPEQLFLFTPGKGSVELEQFIAQPKDINLITPATSIGKTFPSLWRSGGMMADIKQNDIQVYHGLSNELPSGFPDKKVKSVVTIHDLIFKRFPQFYPWVDRNIYDYKFRKSCKAADRIIAISEQTKKDIVDYYNIPPDKIQVIYQAAGTYLRTDVLPAEVTAIKEKYKLPNDYLLSVGTVEERKNLLLVLKALTLLPPDMQAPLVIVGKPTAYKQTLQSFIAGNNLKNKIFFLEGIDTAELQVLYAGAHAFVYPSRFEGFGIPVIEALHYGVPTIAATGSSLKEAGGDYSLYVNPDSEGEMKAALKKVLSDTLLREQMAAEGKKHVQRFNARQFAHEVMQCYQAV